MNIDTNEAKVLKMILLRIWADRHSMQFQEMLGDESETEEFLEDVITDLTEKVRITPEETW